MDYEICRGAARLPRGPRLERAGRRARLGASHNRITEEEAFARWFYHDSNAEWSEVAIEPISGRMAKRRPMIAPPACAGCVGQAGGDVEAMRVDLGIASAHFDRAEPSS